MKFAEIISSLEQAKDLNDWFGSLNKVFQDGGFSQTLFALKTNKDAPNEKALVLTSYSQQWREKYSSANYQNVDPTVEHSLKSSLPIFWEPNNYKNEQRDFFEEASAYGLRSGITLPLHDPDGRCGLLSLVVEGQSGKYFSDGYIRDRLLTAIYIRDIALETSKRFLKDTHQKATPVSLTGREKEVIKWSAAGKTSWEIAKILSCSESTINFHFNNIRSKFNVNSRRQAIIKAIQGGAVLI